MLTPATAHEGPDSVLDDTAGQTTTAELLGLCDEFFRCHASPIVHAELRQFLTHRGQHPIAGHGAFIDRLGFAAMRAAHTGASVTDPDSSRL